MGDTKVFDFYGTIEVDGSNAVRSLEAIEDKAKSLTKGDIQKVSVEFQKVFDSIEESSKVDFSGLAESVNKEFSGVDKDVEKYISDISRRVEELNKVLSSGATFKGDVGISSLTEGIQRDIEELERYLEDNGVSQVVGADLDRLSYEVTSFNGGLGNIEQKVRESAEGVKDSLRSLVAFADGVFDDMKSFGMRASLMLTAPITKNAKSILPKVLDEDDARRRLENMSGIIGDEMEVLESQLVAAAKDTGTQISDMFRYAYDSSSGGISSDMLGEFTEYVDKVAVVTGTSGEEVSNVMTTMSSVFEADVSSMANQLLKLEKIGKNSMSELSSHLGKMMPSADRAGESLQGMNTSLAVLTQSGQNVARSTTHLKNIYEEFGNKYSEVNMMLVKETGSTFAELKEAGMSTAEVFETMIQIGDDAGISMSELFGESATFLEIIAGSSDLYTEKFEEMSQATTELEDDLANLNEGPMQEYKTTLFEVEQAFKDLWATAMPVFQDIMEKVVELSESFQSLDDHTKESIVQITILAAVVGPIAGVIGQIGSSIIGLGTTIYKFAGKVGQFGVKLFAKLSALIGFKAAVVVGVVAVVASLTFLGVKIIKGNEKIKLSFERLFIDVQVGFRKFVGGIAKIFFKLVDTIGKAGAKIFGYDYEEGNSRMRQFADDTEEYVRLKEEEKKAIGTKITMIKAEELAAKKAKENRAMDARFEEREKQKKLKEKLKVEPIEIDYRSVDDIGSGPAREDIERRIEQEEGERLKKEREKRKKEVERKEKEALRREKERNKILKERLKIEKNRHEFLKAAEKERDRLRMGSALVNRLDSSLAVVAKSDRYRFEGKAGKYEQERAGMMKTIANTVLKIEKHNKDMKDKDDVEAYRKENEDLENLLRVSR